MLRRKQKNIPPPHNSISKEEIFNIKENVRFIITSKKNYLFIIPYIAKGAMFFEFKQFAIVFVVNFTKQLTAKRFCNILDLR